VALRSHSVIKTEDGKGNVGEYKFNLNADPKVVGSPTPTASPKPSKTPTPVSKAKPYISTMTLVEKNNADFLSVQVSWNIRANLKLYVLNNKEKVVKIIWTSVQIRAGKKTVLWNLKDSKNVSIKVGLYRMKFAADEKYFSKWFRKI